MKNNIIIREIPITEESDKDELKDSVARIAKTLDVNITDEDFICFKVGGDENKQIKVVFASIDEKNRMMEKKC